MSFRQDHNIEICQKVMKFKIRKWRVCLVGGKCNLINLLMVDTLCQLSGWDQSSICSIVCSLRRSQISNQLFGFSQRFSIWCRGRWVLTHLWADIQNSQNYLYTIIRSWHWKTYCSHIINNCGLPVSSRSPPGTSRSPQTPLGGPQTALQVLRQL